jgi:alkylated DNA repair dioxygenase AlkB
VVATLSLGSPATMRFRPRANAAEKKKRKETHLTLILRHVGIQIFWRTVLNHALSQGDVVVMEGSKIQVHYE